MTVGVLALQGCVEPHLALFKKLGVDARTVRSPEDLAKVDRLLLPGGESTTMLRLLETSGLAAEIQKFGTHHPVWGVCAGAILIAREVHNPKQRCFSLMDISATRNFYGSQIDSFKAQVAIDSLEVKVDVDFIRAPLLTPLTLEVEVLARHQMRPILLKQGHIMACSFHIELGEGGELHRYFASL